MRLARWLRHPIVWLPVSIGLLALLGWRSKIWETAVISDISPVPLAAAALLSAVVPLLWALRSAGLLAATARPVGIRPLIPMTALANTINNLTPGSAGEVLRLYLLRAHHGVEYISGGAVILVERLGAMGYLVSSSLLSWLTWIGALPAAVSLGLIIALVALPGLLYGRGLRPLEALGAPPLGAVMGRERWAAGRGHLGRLDVTIARLVGDPRRLLAFTANCAMIFTITTVQLILVGRAVGVTVEPLAAWGALGLATTAGVASLLPFGLGATDLTLVALLGIAGVPPAQAAAMAFGYRLVSTLPLGLAGVASYAYLSASLPEAALDGRVPVAGADSDPPHAGVGEP
jgi:uncharacterized membrane protein YbhN (UPF0104 family)